MGRFADAARGHDFTGVFVTEPTDDRYIVLTACHHDDNEFYELGVVQHEVDYDTLLRNLPETPPHDCDAASICWMLDFHDGPRGMEHNREITVEQASAMLGVDAQVRLARGRENLSAFYAKMPG